MNANPDGTSSTSVGSVPVAAGSNLAASITLGLGSTVTCTFTNSLLPQLTIIKSVTGGSDTFGFTVTGANPLAAPTTNLTPPNKGSAAYGLVLIVPGNNTISEDAPPADWTLTDAICTGYTGGGTGAGPLDTNGIPTNWNFTANYGDSVVCS